MAITGWCLIAVSMVTGGAFPADDDRSPVGRRIDGFELQDYRGKTYRLADFAESRLLVVAYLGTECPLARLYSSRLVALRDEYAERGVGFVGVNSNSQDSITEIAAHARRHEIPFPILKDVGNHLADHMGAERTPEVFVLDADRVVRYRGRIDDQFGIGYSREKPTRRDLQAAIDELLAGRPVSVAETEAAGCHIGRISQPDADSAVTYSNQIARILQKRCVQCHRAGEIAPFELVDYGEVAGWAEMIAEVVRDERMPPWHADPNHGSFSNDRRLSDEEKRLIHEWVEAGAPEGDRAMLPEPVAYPSGWQLPQVPDQVFSMRETPYRVPATGTVEYKYFSVPTGFEEDKWVKAVEVLPGNTAVVHHILVLVQTRDGDVPSGGGVRGFLAAYVPGLRAVPFADGMAKRIPAGSSLIFQLHYTPIGSPQTDQSKVGFVFADPKDVEHEIKTVSAYQQFIRIPGGADNHREETRMRIGEPARLLSMMPHMHVRGKAFRYDALVPGADAWQTLLDVPRYDFNWQTSYLLDEPLDLPAGTLVRCIAHYDNSEGNLNNPDPTRTVTWGDQTWDEMLIGYFDVAVPKSESRRRGGTSLDERAEELLLQIDRNGDGKIEKSELPERLGRMFPLIDKDRDGFLTVEEIKALVSRGR